MPEPQAPANIPPHLNSDPAHWTFQYLEDLATGYWYSQVLFCALDLDLFAWIEKGRAAPDDLAKAAACNPAALARLLTVLERMELIHTTPDGMVNSQLARRFLVPGQPDYMGDFIRYRSYMQAGWSALMPAVARPDRPGSSDVLTPESDYAARNFHYVRAMDSLARLKAREIVARLDARLWFGPILDVGGGAGALARDLVRAQQDRGETVTALLFDLPEVLQAARRLYPLSDAWQNIETVAGDFRHFDAPVGQTFGLVVLSNFLHAYAGPTARQMLAKAAGLTAADGLLLIHDYFPDRQGRRPQKGALYDINMLLNTQDGACHPAATVKRWLDEAGMTRQRVIDLSTDSAVILAGRSDRVFRVVGEASADHPQPADWRDRALALGFSRAELLTTDQIATAVWAREKCRFGCAGFGNNRMCPPDGIDHATLVRMLGEYRWALIVAGAPPGRHFHEQLLALERDAFLAGWHKALAFGAGPCPVCQCCPAEGPCRYPERARPSMEGSGIDVYTTARRAGISIRPVPTPGRYVKYVGMVLLT